MLRRYGGGRYTLFKSYKPYIKLCSFIHAFVQFLNIQYLYCFTHVGLRPENARPFIGNKSDETKSERLILF